MRFTEGSFVTCFMMSGIAIVLSVLILNIGRVSARKVKIIAIICMFIAIRLILPIEFKFTFGVGCTKILPEIYYLLNYKINGFFFNNGTLLVMIWLGVALVKLLFFLNHQYKWKVLLKYSEYTHEYDADILAFEEQYGKPINVRIVETDSLTPSIFGLLHPVIMLPVSGVDEQKRHYILHHEVSHYIRKDLWLSLLCELIVILYWWNPFAYLLKRQLTQAFELENDLSVAGQLSEMEQFDYMDCILDLTKRSIEKPLTGASCFCGKTNIEKRIQLIVNSKKSNQSRRSNIVCVLFLFVVSFFVVIQPRILIPEIESTTVELKPSNSFIVVNNDKYDIYYQDKLFITVTCIDKSLSNLRVYGDMKEVNDDKKNK